MAEGRGPPGIRTLFLADAPDAAPQRVYVKGHVVTVLRFEQPVEAARTRLVGGEGRFEPLGIVGRKVILEPRQELDSDEGFSLMVTLADGREVLFLLRPAGHRGGRSADQQLDVFDDRVSCEAQRAALRDAEQENKTLRADNERLRKEEVSEDHALAALLAAGAVAQTPFVLADHFSGKDEDAALDGTLFRGIGKAAVVFVDGSAFLDEGTLTSLFLEMYRQDGLRQAMVQLDPDLIGK
ncbi:DUF2381 family protein [Corallococcus sicarius]|uniref:DUF2381 family protein n=1 Tax=Corallococcus sicarius TaxID=2316726 RepID=A0A3A8NVE5_9BACT|nr:DUF2381 family protein [Corallococcus sicarius]RKH48188.1 DUF2381 family protein [Corallococcus sicarius]